ncbi:hypothetical protein, partial [Streptomyces sp. SID4917]|uniref:hypothetical protein n=1 Tax=Streptomyces sp. SID4917 TaxID=2690269 RepID=UPI001928CBFD
VMAPWGYTQVCTEKPTTGGSNSGGSDGGKDDDKDKDKEEDQDDDKDKDETETECNPVMAPWGYTQVCTEKPTTGGSDGG